MTILFIGNEDSDFNPIGTPAVTTNTSFFDPNYCRCALAGRGGSSINDISVGWQVVLASPTTGVNWVKANYYASSYINSSNFLVIKKGTTPLIQLVRGINTNVLEFRVYNGSWSSTLASFGHVEDVLTKIAIALQPGTPGTCKIYSGEALVIDYSGNINGGIAATGFDTLCLGGGSSSNTDTYWSEVIIADEDCRTWRLYTSPPDGAGFYSAWTGAYTDIDEITLADTDLITSSAADQFFSFSAGDIPLNSAQIKAVGISARVSRGTGGLAHIAIGVRSGGSDNVGSDLSPSTSYGNLQRIMTTNPITAANWTRAEVNAVEGLLKSRT